MTLVNYKSCLNCPFMSQNNYSASPNSSCMECFSSIMKREAFKDSKPQKGSFTKQ